MQNLQFQAPTIFAEVNGLFQRHVATRLAMIHSEI